MFTVDNNLSRHYMKQHFGIITILASIKLIIQLMGNGNYGYHRDELLHLSASEHLDWGYMEFPPLIGLIGKISYLLFDYTLMGTRLFPTLAGVGIVVVCCLIAKELNANRYGILLAGICVLAFLPFYRNHTLFQPVAFDQLFWTFGFYYIIRYIKTEDYKYLLFTGVTLGVGLMNKYTILVWAFGVLIGMIFHQRAKVFKNKWWYASGFLALLIFLPNVIWQIQNNLPILRHLHELSDSQLSQLSLYDFGLEQLYYPFTLIVSLLGVYHLLNRVSYKPIGIAAITIFCTMWLLQSKPYYVFGLYPVLFAAGSVSISTYLTPKRRLWHYGIALIIILPSIPFIPHLTPILPIEQYVAYANLEEQDGRIELQGDYADMFGWDQQVRIVDSLYQSLSDRDKQNCVLWAENYGEAGALKILGKKHGLSNPISRHGSFWLWGYGPENADVWISLGNETPSVEHVFEETELVKIIHHKYAIAEEQGIPVYLCRKPKLTIKQWWKDYEPHIFK